MKIMKSIIILIGILFHVETMYSQDSCIVAGDTTLAHYTDIIPDTIIFDCCYNPPDTFYLDLNNDNQTDFYIVDWYRNYAMGSYGYSYIKGVGENKVLVNSFNNSIPDTLDNTDTVCLTGVWKNSGKFIDYQSLIGDSIHSYNHSEWKNLQNKYVGLKLSHSADSTFGWVQIYAEEFSGTSLTVKNYGCGSITPYVPPLTPPLSVSSEIIVYPNPTYDIVNINLPNYTGYEIKLYTDIGEIVYRNYGNQKVVDLTGMPVGTYILKIQTSDRTISEKIIKRRKPN